MENSSTKTPWHVVYQKIATELHRFYVSYEENAGYELYQLLTSTPEYRRQNLWLDNITRIEKPSIDPIQVFVSFSRSGQKEQSRTEIINIIWKLFNPNSTPWEYIDFDGCPTPVAIKLNFVRSESVQKRMWEVFSNITIYGRNSLTDHLWQEVRSWRGIEIPSFTIFLFWIDAEEYIPLDINTQAYLEAGGVLPTRTKFFFATYAKLLENKRIRNYIQLSKEAFYFNSNIQLFRSKFRNGMFNLDSNINIFRVVGLKILDRNNDLHKILHANLYYPFDGAMIEISTEGDTESLQQFEYIPSAVESIYHLGNLRINITAIVGKNGSGKSTLLELLLMAIYNLSIRLGLSEDADDVPIKNLNIEVYWLTDTLYKLVFDHEIRLYAFELKKQNNGRVVYTLNQQALPFTYFNYSFFYSILVNYSHYALNSNDYSVDWISPLSHKNDGYVSPIVINPQRSVGNIDINREKTLLNMRLLHNLLDLHEVDFPKKSFRCIDVGKNIQSFTVTFDDVKSDKKIKELNSDIYGNDKVIQLFISEIAKKFDLPKECTLDLVYSNAIRHYMVAKLLSIVGKYPAYRKRHKQAFDNLLKDYGTSRSDMLLESEIEMALQNRIELLVQDVKSDNSHVTIKFRQAVNCLRYIKLQDTLMQCLKTRTPIDLDDYNKLTTEIINSNHEIEISTGDLLPPAIFRLDFFLNDLEQSNFSKASSGEYQLVSVLSSLIYHLRNIDSVEESSRYNQVAILLDEIELYFHPNMQRLFVNKLVDAFGKMQDSLNEVRGIHILFSTHSPFILSDLQQDKILKLKQGEIEKYEDRYNTFAANLHDLLADEFFLQEGFMGAFAQKKIETVINALNYARTKNALGILTPDHNDYSYLHPRLMADIVMHEKNLRQLDFWGNGRNPEDWDIRSEREGIAAFIEAIGEPLIKDNLRSMYRAVFEINYDEREKARLRALQLIQDFNINPSELR